MDFRKKQIQQDFVWIGRKKKILEPLAKQNFLVVEMFVNEGGVSCIPFI